MGASPAPRMGWPSRDRAADGVCFVACRCLDFLRLFRLRRFREVGGGGGHMSGLQNFLQLFRLHLLVGVAADGAASFSNRNKIHDMLSFLNSLMADDQEYHLL